MRQTCAQRMCSHTVWECIQLGIFLWNCVVIPLRLSYLETENIYDNLAQFNVAIMVLDHTGDIFYVLDILVRKYVFTSSALLPRISSVVMPEIGFETRYQQHEQHEKRLTSTEKRRRHIFARVFTGGDIIAAIPFDLIALAAGLPNPYQFRLIKLIKMLRVNEQFAAIAMALERRRVIVNAGIHRMIYLWAVFTVSAHWLACGFFSVGKSELASLARINPNNAESWVTNDYLLHWEDELQQVVPNEGVDALHLYVRSIYWAIVTMVTVGFGDIVPAASSTMETVFALSSMYIGMMLTCMIIGNLTNMVANLDHAEDEFHNRIDNLNKYMAYRHLSTDLRDRIRAYYTYMWTSLKGVNEEEFLSQLPVTLRLEVAGLRSKDLVKHVPFLRKAREPIINAICVVLEQVIVSPGDFVVKKGQAMHGCHWLRRGDADQLGPDDVTVQQQLSGKQRSFFGEGSLFFPGVYENSIKAKSYCEFFYLKRQTFQNILKDACPKAELEELKEAAEKAQKRNAKVKKFFGLDTAPTGTKGWRVIFEPNSRFREIWNIIGMMGVLYNAILVPYRLATQTLRYDQVISPNQFVWDWLFDFLFVMDVIFRASLFAFVREGIVVRDRTYIFANYRKHESWIRDLCISFPIDIIIVLSPIDLDWIAFCRFPKMFKLAYFMRHYDIAQNYLAIRRITFTNAIHRITKIFVFVILFSHCVGCGWIFMSKLSETIAIDNNGTLATYGHDPKENDACMEVEMNWVCLDKENWNQIDHGEPFVTYLRAIYFVIVDMTTVGYGDIVPKNTRETVYVALITLFGGLGYPAVVGAMAALIGSLNLARAEFRAKLSILTQYMSMKKFPRQLKVRISRYYDYLWSRQRGVDEDRILNDLPSGLRMEVQEYINGSIMRNISFFADVDSELLRHLLSVLQPSVFLPNDEIITADEMGQVMFLLERGATRITSKDGKMTYAVLTPGDYFGEGCLLGAVKRTANVIAIGYCDCFTLHRDDFDRVTKQFPEQREQVIAKLKDTLEEKSKKNVAVMRNMKEHDKLKAITSYDYTVRRSISDTSWRHPDSFKRRIWDLILLGVTLYNTISIPFRISLTGTLYFFILDYLMDTIIIADVFFHFKYFGYVFEGDIYTDTDDIKQNYWKRKRFSIDVLTCFPFDVFALVGLSMGMETAPLVALMSLLRLPKLLLLLRINPLVRNLDTLFESCRFRDYDAVFRLFKLLVMVVSISHWTGCLFYAVANYMTGDGHSEEYCSQIPESVGVDDLGAMKTSACPMDEYFDTPGLTMSQLSCGMTHRAVCNWNNTWIGQQIKLGLLPQDGGTVMHRYVRAINWALPTLVVVVIGDVMPVTTWGTLYVTMGIIVGVTINAAIIGNIANLVANLEGALANYRERMDQFEHFLYLYRIPKNLQQRTRNYLEYVWDTQKGISQDQLVQDMPATLRTEMSNFLKLKFIKTVPFFEFCDAALQKGIASKLTQQVYSPMDYIVYEGDLGTEMFFLEQGLIQVVSFRGNWRSLEHRNSVVSGGNGSVGSMGSMSSLGGTTRHIAGTGNAPNHPWTRRNSRTNSTFHVLGQNQMGRNTSSATTARDSASQDNNGQIREDQVIVLGQLEPGAFFGETALFFNERRATSVRAIDFCQCYALHKADLNEILSRYPHDFEKMYDIISKLRQNNFNRNENVKANMERFFTQDRKHQAKMIGSKNTGTVGSIMFGGTATGSVIRFSQMVTRRGSALLGLKGSTGKIFPSEGSAPGQILGEDGNNGSLKKNKGTSNQMSTLISGEAEKKKNKGKGSRSLRDMCFKPSDPFYIYWNVVALVFTIVYTFTTPYRLAFFDQDLFPFKNNGEKDPFLPPSWLVWVPAEYIIDLFFMVDIYMRSGRFAINRFGKIIKSKEAIFAHYKSTWLLYDILPTIPFDVIPLVYGIIDGQFPVTLFAVCRLTRLLRLIRLSYYVRVNDRLLADWFPRLNSAVVQTVKLFCLMLLLNHWLACSWFITHRFLERDVHNTWAISDGLAVYDSETGVHNIFNDGLTPGFCYLRAIYFTVTTMSSVGYGDIRGYTLLETIQELVVVVTGACTFAALIGAVAVVYLHQDTRGERYFKAKTRKLIEYMNYRELPNDVQEHIIRHFTQTWERFEGVELREIISVLPLPLQLELSICVHRDIINKVRGLRRCHYLIQRHISRRLSCLLVRADQYVYKSGDIGREIYFILKGQLLWTDPEGQKKKLKDGQHFGGDTLYSVSGERKDSVLTVMDSELYFILKEDFEEIMSEFSDHRNVGIFAELIKPERKTVFQQRELRQQLEEITNKTKTPLTRFTSRHIEDILAVDLNKRNTLDQEDDDDDEACDDDEDVAVMKEFRRVSKLTKTQTVVSMKERVQSTNDLFVPKPTAILSKRGSVAFEDIEEELFSNKRNRQESTLEIGGPRLIRQLSQIQRERSIRQLPF